MTIGRADVAGRVRRHVTRRSIRSAFAVITAIPLVIALAAWGFAGSMIASAAAQGGQASLHGAVLVRVAVAAGIGLVALLVAAGLMAHFACQISRDVARLELSARRFADEQMPRIVERLRRGERIDPSAELPPLPPRKITDIGGVAAALAGVQHTAVTAAAGESGMRHGVSQVFVSLARRNLSLLQRQLRLIDELEHKAADPSALGDLFPLDHLTTRMRRHAEGLIILSGAVPGRAWSGPVPVIDVVRGAIAEVEDYKRVRVTSATDGMMAGSAVADMIHLLAELIENATLFSPSGTHVEVKAERAGDGFAFEIEDRGLGIKPDDLDVINARLGSPADFDLADADRLGLFVVGKLAARHGVRVCLRPSGGGGITAVVVTSGSVVGEAEPPESGSEDRAAPFPHREDRELTSAGQFRRAKLGSPVLPTAALAAAASGPPLPVRRSAPVPQRSDYAPPAGTHKGLPRRVKLASLSPHLRKDAALADTSPHPEPDSHTPEQARDLAAAMQRGWERGRECQILPSDLAAGPDGSNDQAWPEDG